MSQAITNCLVGVSLPGGIWTSADLDVEARAFAVLAPAGVEGFHGGIGMKFRCFQVKVQKDEFKIGMKIPTHGRIDETFSNTA